MTDSALRNAQSRIAFLERRTQEIDREIQSMADERAALENERERVEAFIREWHAFSALTPDNSGGPAPLATIEVGLSTSPKPKNPRKEDVAEAACQVLIEHGSPMGKEDLLQALKDRGVVIHGKRPMTVFTTMMWRMGHVVVRLPTHGYWPANRAYGPAGYEPDDDSSGAEQESDSDLGL